jgi:hypothetical protein
MRDEGKAESDGMVAGAALKLHPKLVGVLESRKAWAGAIGMVTTLTLWSMGEVSGERAVEALMWILGIFIGSVALEDGMSRLFHTLASGTLASELADGLYPVGERARGDDGQERNESQSGEDEGGEARP